MAASGSDFSDNDENFDESENVFSEDERDSKDGGAVMALLASYYGTQPSMDSSADGKDNPLDLDSVSFDAEAYAKEILLSHDVAELMRRDSQLSSEIKLLDGDMQMLVYENYSKFISATETIRRMKENVEAMENEMQHLRSNMEDVSQNSESLENALHDKRTKINKLVRVKRLLHRLDFLSELPQRLTSLIENEAYDRAVELYQKTTNVLQKHEHVLSFKRIQEETEKMIRDVRGTVVRKLEDHSLTANKLANYIGVLLSLGASPVELLSQYTRTHAQRAAKELKEYKSKIQSELAFADERNTFRMFHQVLLADIMECVTGIRTHFTPFAMTEADAGDGRSLTADMLVKELRALLDGCMQPYIAHLSRHTRIVCKHNLATMKDEQPNDEHSPTRLSLSVLRQYLSDLHSIAAEAKLCIPDSIQATRDSEQVIADVGEAAARAVLDVIREICSETMRSARSQTTHGLLGAEHRLRRAGWANLDGDEPLTRAGLNESLASVGTGLDAVVSSAFSVFTGCLHVLRPLLELQANIAGSVGTNLSKVSANEEFTQQFFTQVALSLEKAAGVPIRFELDPEVTTPAANPIDENLLPSQDAAPMSPLTCLLAAQVVQKLGEQVTDVLADQLGRQPNQNQMQALSESLTGSSQRLFLQYIETIAWGLFGQFAAVYEVRRTDEVKGATQEAISLLAALDRVLLDCSLVLQELPPQRTMGAPAHIRIREQEYRKVHARSQTGMSVHLDIERLFAQKVEVFTNSPSSLIFSPEHIVGTVSTAVLKSLLEHARLQCFDLHQYKRAQVDFAVIRYTLPYLLSQTQSQENLIEQLMNAVGGRCTDPHSPALDAHTLSTVVSREHSKLLQRCITMLK